MSAENINAIERFFDEVWNQGRLELVDELCAEDFVDHDPLLGDSGREAAKATIGSYRAAFPDLELTIDEIFAAGDRVILRWTATGTFENELMGLEPTHEKGSPVKGIDIFRFEDGKIAENHGQWETLRFLRELGAIPEGAATPADG